MSFWHGRCHLPFPSQPIMPAEPLWWPAKHGQPCTAFWNPNLALLWWPVNGDRESLQSMAGSGEFPAAAQLPADQAEEQQCRSLYHTACADWGRKGLRSHFRLLSLPFLKAIPIFSGACIVPTNLVSSGDVCSRQRTRVSWCRL